MPLRSLSVLLDLREGSPLELILNSTSGMTILSIQLKLPAELLEKITSPAIPLVVEITAAAPIVEHALVRRK